MPSTRRWLGHAVTVAGSWSNGNIITLKIDFIDLICTVGDDVTTAEVALLIKEAWEGGTLTDTTASCSPSIADGGGKSIPQFAEITATVSGSVVTLTHGTAGVPFTLAVTDSASGDAVAATATTATGRNYFSNQDNWSGNTVPVTADDVVFDTGDVDLKYGLSPAISPANLIITNGYTGEIGLPETNVDDTSKPYREYRTQYLELGATNTLITITIGDGPGSGSGRLKIDTSLTTGTQASTGTALNINGSGQRAETGVPSILWLNGSSTSPANEIQITKGDLGVAFFQGEAANVDTFKVGYQSNQAGDVAIVCGDGLAAVTTLTVDGGLTEIASNVTTATMRGGELIIGGTASFTALNIDGGDVRYSSTGTLTTARVGSGGNLDFRQATGAVTVTNLELHKDSEYHDPLNRVTVTNGHDFDRCQPSDLREFEVAAHQTWTATSI
jgi:hypothetical protein